MQARIFSLCASFRFISPSDSEYSELEELDDDEPESEESYDSLTLYEDDEWVDMITT